MENMIVNEEGKILFVSQEAAGLLGYAASELTGQSLRLLLGKQWATLAWPDGFLEKARAGEWREDLLGQNGQDVAAKLSLTTFRAPGGSKLYVLSMEREGDKAAPPHSETPPPGSPADSEVRADIFRNLHHEIRTPLNTLAGLSGLLAESDLPAPAAESARQMRAAAQDLLDKLNNFLDFGKISNGDLTLEIGGFSLSQALRDFLSPWAARARAKGLEFTAVIEKEVPRGLVGDAGRFGQILTNLVSNAVKWTAQGNVRVRVRKKVEDENTVTLLVEVEDTGTGISPEAAARLFQPLVPGDSSPGRTERGMGLGLVLARELCALMGGTLRREGGNAAGSLFCAEVRFEKGARQPEPPSSDETLAFENGGKTPERRGGYRVLVVEDNSVNQKVITLQLEKLGYASDAVANGREAIEALAKGNYGLVLMDCHMPTLDGYDATVEIRKTGGERKRVPIVALTANDTEEDRQHCRAAGMDDYLVKPASQGALAAVLEKWDSPVDEEALKGLKEMSGEADFPQLREDFLTQTRAQMKTLRKAVAEKDWAAAKATAHMMKGTSGTFGAVLMQSLCRDLERASGENRGDAAEGLLAGIAKEWERVEKYFSPAAAEGGDKDKNGAEKINA